ncbi:hypothetical protein LH53_01265, partial [Mesotoga sp. TolDC]
MTRYRNTILISVLLFIALVFSSCVPRAQLFTIEVVSQNPISVALLSSIEQADFSTSDVKKTPLVLNLKPEETVIVKVIDEDVSDDIDEVYLFHSWADGSVANPRVITADSNKKFEIKTKKSVRVSITSNPKGLVEIEGSGFYPVDTVLTVVTPGEVGGYRFSHWKVNGIADYNESLTIKLESPVKIEAVYEQETLRTLRVETDPKGLKVTIDGKEVESPYVAEFEDGASRALGFAPQEKDLSNSVEGPDTRYSFKSWSDQDGSNPRNVFLKSDLSLKVLAMTEFLVQYSTLPEGIATLKDVSWVEKGDTVSFEAPVVSGYEFTHLEVNGERADDKSLSLVVDSPKSVTAHYELKGYLFSVKTEPSGVEVKIDGVAKISPASVPGTHGSSVSVEIPGPQMKDVTDLVPGLDTRYTFSKWGDSNTSNPRTIVLEADKEVFANLETEYLVETGTYPEGIAEIPGAGWKVKDSLFSYVSPDSIGYDFSHWEVNGIRVDGRSIEITHDSAKKIVAVYTLKGYSVNVNTEPSGLEVKVNGVKKVAPASVVVNHGDTVSLEILTPQERDESGNVEGIDTRYSFTKWNDGNTSTTRNLVLSSSVSYTAQMKSEYLVSVSSSVVSIPGSGWYEKGSSLTLTAPQVENYTFNGWNVNGEMINDNPLALTVNKSTKIEAVYSEIPFR